MTIKCDQCGYENNENYRFCGMCGALLHPKANEAEPTRPAAPPPRPTPPVSGPSFLGLDTERPKDDVSYLLDEEEPSPGHGRMYVALFLLLIAAGVLAWRWRSQGYAWWQKQTNSAAVTSAPVASPAAGTPPAGGGVSTAPSPSEPLAATSQQPAAKGPPPPLPTPGEANTTSNERTQTSPKAPAASEKPAQETASATEPVKPAQTSNAQSEPSAATSKEASDQDTAAEASKPPVPAPKAAAPSEPVTKAAPAVPPEDRLVSEAEKYLHGDGVPENCSRAQTDLQRAAGQGSTKAMGVLATMYATGHCVNMDLPNAYRWFAKALHKDPSNPRLQQNLEVLWRQMSPQERQIATQNE